MANRYKINPAGYAYLLNEAPEVREICHYAGESAASQAEMLGGAHSGFVVDTRVGMRRFHTRVSLVARADPGGFAARGSEAKWGALRNVVPRI